MFFINVKIQGKRNINGKTKQSIERSKHFGGGQRIGWPSFSPPHKVEVPINLKVRKLNSHFGIGHSKVFRYIQRVALSKRLKR